MNTTVEDKDRKYRKELNINGWQCRLIRWSLNIDPKQFGGYCPIFWLSWFCLFISPLVLFAKLIKFGLEVTETFFDFSNKFIPASKKETVRKEIPLKDRPPVRPSDKAILGVGFLLSLSDDIKLANADYYSKYGFYNECAYQEFQWIKQNEEKFFELYNKILKRKEEQKAAAKLAAERAAARKERQKHYLNLIIRYTSWVVKPLLVAVGFGAAYALYKVALWIYQITTMAFLIEAAKFIGIVVGGVAIVAAIIYGLVKVLYHLKIKWDSIPVSNEPQEPSAFQEKLEIFGSKVGKFFEGIGNGVEFLTDTVKVLYKKECPMVIWSDKTGDIEKNK